MLIQHIEDMKEVLTTYHDYSEILPANDPLRRVSTPIPSEKMTGREFSKLLMDWELQIKHVTSSHEFTIKRIVATPYLPALNHPDLPKAPVKDHSMSHEAFARLVEIQKVSKKIAPEI